MWGHELMNGGRGGLAKAGRTTRPAVAVVTLIVVSLVGAASTRAEDRVEPHATMQMMNHGEHDSSASQYSGDSPSQPETPHLPEGMTLDEVLERAAQPPPPDFPAPVPDNMLRFFVLGEQLEYRVQSGAANELGIEGQAWIGFDYDRLWIKVDGEGSFVGRDEGGVETDLLYSRAITPFWNAQVGVQYANGWDGDTYSDRWSGAVSLLGLAPGQIEIDASLYVSQSGDFTALLETEYNIRFTQRLVLQPRTELGFAAQDVSERGLGAGMTDANLDLRLRYEFKREIAPYFGVRYRALVGETADKARAGGQDDDDLFFVTGFRLAY